MCTECPGNTYASERGRSVCTSCDQGKHSSPHAASCTLNPGNTGCPQGHYSTQTGIVRFTNICNQLLHVLILLVSLPHIARIDR